MARTGREQELRGPACQFDKLTYLLDLNNLYRNTRCTLQSLITKIVQMAMDTSGQ